MGENNFKKINFIKKILACVLYLIATICCFISTMAYVNYLDNAKSTNNQQELIVKNTRYAVSRATGTAIPNTGYIEKIYLNDSLSNEEVKEIIENANLDFVLDPNGITEESTVYMYGVLCSQNLEKLLLINKEVREDETIDYLIGFGNLNTSTFLWFYSYGAGGWANQSPNILNINDDIIDTIPLLNYSIGQQNEALTSLFSSAPFTTPTLTESFLGGVASASGQFLAVLTSAFSSVENVFLTTEGELTLVGMFLAISIGAVVITFAIRLLIKLINKIRLNG